jgi:hypothetical protein
LLRAGALTPGFMYEGRSIIYDENEIEAVNCAFYYFQECEKEDTAAEILTCKETACRDIATNH